MFVAQSDFYWNGQDIRDRSFELACTVVQLTEILYGRGGAARTMAPQLVGCSTSVAAMLEEARGAESRKDFVSKVSIALKEARETHVRLRICARTLKALPNIQLLIAEASEVAAIIGAVVRNARAAQRVSEGVAAKRGADTLG